MANVVGRLIAKLGLDSAEFESGSKKAQKSMNGLSATMIGGAKAAGVAIGVLGGALTALGIKQAKAADESVKAARSFGVALKDYQAISLVAEEAGVNQEQLAVALTKTQKAIAEAANGGTAQDEIFNRLNLSVKDLLSLSPDKQFEAIATALAGVANPTERTALALEIFGKSGRGVINMLEDYKGKALEAAAFQERFNLSLSDVDARQIEEANDIFGRVLMVLDGLGNTIAVKVAPLVTALANEFFNSSASADSFGKIADAALAGIGVGVDVVRGGFIGLQAVFVSLKGIAAEFLSFILNIAVKVDTAFVDLANKFPNVSLKYSEGLQNLSQDAKDVAAGVRAEFGKLEKDAANFERTNAKIKRAQEEARKRAESAQANTPLIRGGVFEGESQAASGAVKQNEKLIKQNEKLKEQTQERNDGLRQLGLAFSSSFEQAIEGGKKLSDVLDGLAKDIQRLVIRRTVTEPLLGAFDSVISSAFSGITLPSFATGSQYITRDTLARVHQGEAIIPAQQVKSMNGNGEVSIIVNNNSSAQVSTSTSTSGNNTQIMMMVDDAMASNISRSNSRSRRSLNTLNSQQLVRR